MKKFIIKLFMFFGLTSFTFLLICIVFFTNIAPQYSQNYAAAFIDKAQRLMSIEEPKIILVGDSNVVFGINSEELEREVCMPVVNMGLYGGSSVFLEEVAKLNIQKGDILIVCHSDYIGNDSILPEQEWITLENHFELWKVIRKQDVLPMLKALPNYMLSATYLWLTGKGNLGSDNAYSRDAFNEYGDNIYPRKESKFTFTEGRVSVPQVNSTIANRLNRLNSYCTDHGATLLIAGYPIGYGEYTPDEKLFIEFQDKLADSVDCDVISDFTDYFFEYKYFYDTHLHLTEEGARLRTRQLINDLKQWMKSH